MVIFRSVGASSPARSNSHLVCVSFRLIIFSFLLIFPDRAQHLALFLHARSLISAAVRMNTIGPYLAQQLLLRDVRPIIDAFVAQCSTLSTAIFIDSNREDADELSLNGPANTWPLGEILAMRHDLQHSRIFNS